MDRDCISCLHLGFEPYSKAERLDCAPVTSLASAAKRRIGHANNQYAPGSVADGEAKALADVVGRVRIMQKAMPKTVQRAPHRAAKAS
jgi:hypothetical protein